MLRQSEAQQSGLPASHKILKFFNIRNKAGDRKSAERASL